MAFPEIASDLEPSLKIPRKCLIRLCIKAIVIRCGGAGRAGRTGEGRSADLGRGERAPDLPLDYLIHPLTFVWRTTVLCPAPQHCSPAQLEIVCVPGI